MLKVGTTMNPDARFVQYRVLSPAAEPVLMWKFSHPEIAAWHERELLGTLRKRYQGRGEVFYVRPQEHQRFLQSAEASMVEQTRQNKVEVVYGGILVTHPGY